MVPEPPRQSADDFENIILHWSFPRLEMIEPLRKGLGLKKTAVWMGWVKENLDFTISYNMLYQASRGTRVLNYNKAVALFTELQKGYTKKVKQKRPVIGDLLAGKAQLYKPHVNVPISQVRSVCQSKEYSQCPVGNDEGELAGVLTSEMLASRKSAGLTAGEVMQPINQWPVFPPDMPMEAIMESIRHKQVALILDDSGEYHIITAWDINSWLIESES
jgi:predicted transcriptional regulator